MDTLEIEGKQYVSAKRAAREHSYTMDYVGQLIRGGKLVGKKVGRAWYVENDSLVSYLHSLSETRQEHVIPLSEPAKMPEEKKEIAAPHTDPGVAIPVDTVREKESNNESIDLTALISKKNFSEEKVLHTYPMLRYVRSDEESLLPELSNPYDSTGGREDIVKGEVETHEIPLIKNKAISVAPASMPYRQEIRIREGGRRDPLPMRHQSILPALLGAAAFLIMITIAGASTLLSRTFNYNSVAASIESGLSYSDLYENLVNPR